MGTPWHPLEKWFWGLCEKQYLWLQDILNSKWEEDKEITGDQVFDLILSQHVSQYLYATDHELSLNFYSSFCLLFFSYISSYKYVRVQGLTRRCWAELI